MNKARDFLVSIGLVVVGILILLGNYNMVIIETQVATTYLLLFYGLIFVITSMNGNSRGLLILGSLLFMAGLILFIVSEFEILNPVKTVLPSILISFGAAFFLLFVDNSKEKVFLFISVILMGTSVSLIFVLKDHYLYSLANSVSFLILEFWPILITLLGLGVLLNRHHR